MNIVFMGTPEFSVPTLQQLHKSIHNIQLVVTQPDRPKGRGRESVPSPIKLFALKEGIPVSRQLLDNFVQIGKNYKVDFDL